MSKRKLGIVMCCVAAVLVLGIILVRNLMEPSSVPFDLQTQSLDKEVLGARKYGMGEISVNESGIFYFDASRLAYYDYETEEKYILCSTPQCKHDSEECNAYMGDKEVCGGYALYDGKIYVVYKEHGSKDLELVSMDTTGQNKRTVARIPVAGDSLEEWRVSLIKEVYYYQGYAYMQLEWTKNETYGENYISVLDGEQLLAVSLDGGETTELTEVLCWDAGLLSVGFEQFTDGNAIFSWMHYDEKRLTAAEFYEEDSESDYLQYSDEFYENTSASLEYQMFVPETSEIKSIRKDPAPYVEEKEFNKRACLTCVYQGKWLMFDLSNEEPEYYWFDPESGETESFLYDDVTPSKALGWFYGEASSSLYDGKYLLYKEELADGREQICKLDLDTGNTENLFVQEKSRFAYDGFLIMAETSEYLVGRQNGGSKYYIVRKSDYETSDREKAKEVSFW